ncbi:hypothetical protein M011DRAFT_478832 [Sporormia fimetaria CBS 119925]|uniref:Uncharacterized protein n=1 Tax=Sporormia fimetaria CBS 119925 TaxID=1340428 RepID=A0A6A6V4W8_9PLEO|nr:hypothetical protein M011DRAFT_478832 [Sporormia fimetaria CBS 119925]
MTELSSQYVKRGFWVNRSEGPVLGQMLTTDTTTGNIVIALLAVCTTMGMTHLWHLVIFAWHQIRANGQPADGVHQQHQALFRTLPAPSSLAADCLKIGYAWRNKMKDQRLSLVLRTLSTASVALLFTLASLAASIFSSFAMDGTNIEVLVDSPRCGFGISNALTTNTKYLGLVHQQSGQYAEECYREAPGSRCKVFSRLNLPLTVENVTCPFGKSMCVTDGLSFDTGLMDLAADFGFNIPPREGVQFQKRTNCSVLSLEGRTSLVDGAILPQPLTKARDPLPGEKFRLIHLGTMDLKYFPGIPEEWGNVTRTYSEHMRTLQDTFTVTSLSSFPHDPNQPIKFMPELAAEDAVTALMLIWKGATVEFNETVNDPLFSAHQKRTRIDSNYGMEMTNYVSDAPVSMVGCTEEYQICATDASMNNHCTTSTKEVLSLPQSHYENIPKFEQFPEATELQSFLIQLVANSLAASQVISNTDLQTGLITSTLIGRVPNDQWTREVRRWVVTGLAKFQMLLSDYAIGPIEREPESEYQMPPPTPVMRQVCGLQKMRKSGDVVNISVFALAFIIVFTAVVFMLDLYIIRILIYIDRFQVMFSPRVDRWIQDGFLQLQRRAYEAQGDGVWEGLNDDIPVTSQAVKLPDLTTSNHLPLSKPDLKHPTNTFGSAYPETLVSESGSAGKGKMEVNVHVQQI